MSGRYQKQYTIPEDFPVLLKNFSREILRTQPIHIYEFGARYFSCLLAAQEAAEADAARRALDGPGINVAELTTSELEELILQKFLVADKDGNGYLDPREFVEVMRRSKLGLSRREIRRIMAECDENEDGVIEYREFLPIMVQVVHGLKAKSDLEAVREEEESGAREQVEAHLLHGMPHEELEAMMRGIFRAADVNEDGKLDRKEFKRCLRSADIGFTRQELNVLLAEADVDHDGCISYEEFLPVCFSILVERFTEELLTEQRARSQNEMSEAVMARLMAEDKDGSGTLTQAQIKGVLATMSREGLGLTRLQVLSIMSEAEPDVEGRVKYAKFVPLAARMIYTMIDLSHQAQRAAAIQSMARGDGVRALRGMNRDTVTAVLLKAFQEADEDGSGALDRAEVSDVLQALEGGELGLKAAEINALLAAVDENEDGFVHYNELIDFMYDVLLHLDKEIYVQEMAFQTMKGHEAQGRLDDTPTYSTAEE